MKSKLLVIMILMHATCAFAGEIKPLKLGDRLPDRPVGKFLLSKKNEGLRKVASWADLQGKVLILDFWNLHCGSCIEAFPKMSKLQQTFEKDIQVILVNPFDSEDELNAWLRQQRERLGRDIIPENLPVLLSKEILSWFPMRTGLPYHVWIDKTGVFTLRGSAFNTYESKVRDFIAGRKVAFLEDILPPVDYRNTAFHVVQDSSSKVRGYFNSFVSGYSKTLASPNGNSGKLNVVDSQKMILRNTWLNISAENLYLEAFKRELSSNEKVVFGHPVSISVRAPKKVSANPKYYGGTLTDEAILSSGYCYEQIVPLGTSDDTRRKLMQDDLNRSFRQMIGVSASFEEAEMECMIVTATKSLQALASGSDKMEFYQQDLPDGTIKRIYKGCTVSQVFQELFLTLAGRLPFSDKDALVIDGSEFDGKIDITFLLSNQVFNNLAEFQAWLQSYGFKIEKGRKRIESLVIRDSN